MKAGAIGGQQREVEAGLLEAAGVLLEAAAGGDVGLQAEDRVDAQVLGLPVELQCPVQVAVVGQGQGVHLQGLGPVQQALDGAGPVQEAVMAMAVQMGEGMGGQRNSSVCRAEKRTGERLAKLIRRGGVTQLSDARGSLM